MSRTVDRRLAFALGATLGVVALPLGALALDGTAPFEPGGMIKAQDFVDLWDAVVSLEAESSGQFCGATPTDYNGALGGYGVAQSLCATACGSSTAHLCSCAELARSAQAGKAVPSEAGWCTGPRSVYLVGDAASGLINDCEGWTSNDETPAAERPLGHTWNNGPGVKYCSFEEPLFCCD